MRRDLRVNREELRVFVGGLLKRGSVRWVGEEFRCAASSRAVQTEANLDWFALLRISFSFDCRIINEKEGRRRLGRLG